jgi:DNA transformation protein
MSFLHEVFEEFGQVQTRPMFGGYGVYFEGVMFGLVADDCLYLKADETSRKAFLARGLTLFEYHRNGKTIKMSYYLAPEEMFEEPSEAAKWARLAYQAGSHAQNKRRRS